VDSVDNAVDKAQIPLRQIPTGKFRAFKPIRHVKMVVTESASSSQQIGFCYPNGIQSVTKHAESPRKVCDKFRGEVLVKVAADTGHKSPRTLSTDFAAKSASWNLGLMQLTLCDVGFSVDGPARAEVDGVDNGDGSVNATYLPAVAGEHAVHVLCDDEDIIGSPFMVDVQPAPPADRHFDPSKVCLSITILCILVSTVSWSGLGLSGCHSDCRSRSIFLVFKDGRQRPVVCYAKLVSFCQARWTYLSAAKIGCFLHY